MAEAKNVYQRLLDVQTKAIAPRQESRFRGGSRSAEQILEAVKKPCHAEGLLLFTTEEVELVGDRTRIKATATVVNVENPDERISASASAWEGELSAGLDASQVSGKTGSYAKKYALQNLFSIDDTKDADFEHHEDVPPHRPQEQAPRASSGKGPSDKQLGMIRALSKELGIAPEVYEQRIMLLDTSAKASEAIDKLQEAKAKKEEA